MHHPHSHTLIHSQAELEQSEDDSFWPDILDKSEDKEKTRVGKEYQTYIPNFNLNDASNTVINLSSNFLGFKVRKLRRLRWNPTRLGDDICTYFELF